VLLAAIYLALADVVNNRLHLADSRVTADVM
jgi:hypothetical protein